MAGLLDLFSGRSSDIYGNGLLTPEQRGGLGNIGLLALAGKLGQLAGPSFSPVPDFGAALGQAAGAYGASQEGAGTAALNAILTGQRGRKLEQELDYYKQLGPVLGKLAGQWPGADGGAGGGEGSGSTGGGAAAPLSAGGGGGGGVGGTPGTITLDQARQAAVNAGFTGPAIDIAAATGMAESNGNPLAHNTKGENSYGYMQLNADAHGDKVKTFDLQEQMNHAFAISKQGTDFSPWTMYRNGQYKKYLSPGSAAPTAAAPAGGGGLLNLPDPSGIGARAGFGLPQGAGPLAAPAAGVSPEDTANRIIKGWTAGAPTPGQGASEEPPGFAGRQLVAQLLARPPLDEATQYQQVAGPGGGEGPIATAPIPPRPAPPPLAIPDLPPQAAAALAQAPPGLLMPGGGLLPRGGGAIPGMPPAVAPADAMPSDDPRFQLGPLAAPAPAAAAPAAPGPGLLSPPGAPAAALPRVNPAYDAWLRNAGVAAALVKGAGLPDALTPLIGALKDSPAYQAQVELAKRLGVLPLIGPEETAKRAAGLPFIGPETTARAGAEQPFLLQRDAFKNALDNLANGRIYDEASGSFKSVPGFSRTLAEQEQAKAVGSKSQDTTEVTVQGADGRTYKQLIPQTDLAQKLREQPPAIPGQPAAPGTIVGVRQAGPLDTLGVETLKDAGTAAKAAYGRMQEYGQLAQAAQGFTTGPTAEKWFEVKRYLKDAGIIAGTEVPDQEIFQIAQRRLAAAAAPKGQGATSDYERSLFAAVLPTMATSREGLARAIAIANRLDQYDVKVAQIHEDVARSNNGYPDYLQVQQRLRELGPPLSEGEKAALMAVSSGAAPGGAPAAAPAAGGQPQTRIWNPATKSFGPPQ